MLAYQKKEKLSVNEIKYYDLNPSQEVVKLQCKYTLFKRVINILTSATAHKDVDTDIMKKALIETIKRNDCLRLRFVKKDGKLMQYFASEEEITDLNIPFIEFHTKEEQEEFFASTRKKAIDYLNGVVIEPYFCKTYDGKFMLVMKVCHLILDIYGLNNIYKDLFEVYEALKESKELPPRLAKFEDVIKKDLTVKYNKEIEQKNRDFFTKYLSEKEEPYFAGLHGPNEPIFQKQMKKGRHSTRMFFIKNDTQCYMHPINSNLVARALDYCQQTKCSVSNFFFYTMAVTASKLNNEVKNLLPLELCNCRGTMTERKCAGTKVQSVVCYTVVDKEKTFEENFLEFSKEQTNLYRYIGFSDQEVEMLLHKIYKKPFMNTFYSFTFSFIPMQKSKDFDVQVYSNGKCALPAYVALMWDIATNEIDVVYDCYKKTHTVENVKHFHDTFLSIIEQVLDNSQTKIIDIKV